MTGLHCYSEDIALVSDEDIALLFDRNIALHCIAMKILHYDEGIVYFCVEEIALR